MESSAFQDRLVYSHADCLGGRRIEMIRRSGEVTALTSYEAHHGEPSLAADGKRLVFTVDRGDDIEFAELRLGSAGKPVTLWRGPREGVRFRPQYLSDGRVMFQNGTRVLLIDDGKVEVWSELRGVKIGRAHV